MTKSRGGKRPGSGPPRRRLALSKKGGHDLAQLTERWRKARNNPALSEEAIVEELIQTALQQEVPSIPPQS